MTSELFLWANGTLANRGAGIDAARTARKQQKLLAN